MLERWVSSERNEMGLSGWEGFLTGKGRYWLMSSSRSNLPFSQSCMAAVAVTVFEMEPIFWMVRSGSIATRRLMSAHPYPFDQTTLPGLDDAGRQTRDPLGLHLGFDEPIELGARGSGLKRPCPDGNRHRTTARPCNEFAAGMPFHVRSLKVVASSVICQLGVYF